MLSGGSETLGRDGRGTVNPLMIVSWALEKPDAESQEWLRRLRDRGSRRSEALADLHAILLRVAHSEAGRRRASLPEAVVADLDDLCEQATDDALARILASLDRYAGRSRFTTWAIKFALLETSTALRRHAWRGRTVKLDDDGWGRILDARAADPQRHLEHHELLRHLKAAVDEVLTQHQRRVFVAAAVREVPIDVLAERLGSNRGAVYKTLHDARRKLRAALAEAGHQVIP
jgi:RNA polymerase sigma-70 factor, ECF subfamily